MILIYIILFSLFFQEYRKKISDSDITMIE